MSIHKHVERYIWINRTDTYTNKWIQLDSKRSKEVFCFPNNARHVFGCHMFLHSYTSLTRNANNVLIYTTIENTRFLATKSLSVYAVWKKYIEMFNNVSSHLWTTTGKYAKSRWNLLCTLSNILSIILHYNNNSRNISSAWFQYFNWCPTVVYILRSIQTEYI